MRLRDLLSPRRVVVPLAAADLEEAIRVLIEACVADGWVRDRSRLDEIVRERWPEDTTGMGPHVWLPHFRSDAVESLVVALGVAQRPLPGRDPAGADRRIVLLVVAPPKAAAAYLQTVAGFARSLARPEVAQAILGARRPEDILALPALAETELPGQLLVRDVMSTPVIAIGPDQPLAEAARRLREHGIEALPVVSDTGEVIGILSHRELLRHLVPDYVQRATSGEQVGLSRSGKAPVDPLLVPVRNVMARNVLCVSEDESVAEVASLLAGKEVGRLPVVRDGVLQGFLTRGDIVRKILGNV